MRAALSCFPKDTLFREAGRSVGSTTTLQEQQSQSQHHPFCPSRKMNQNEEEGRSWGHSPGQRQREFGILPS